MLTKSMKIETKRKEMPLIEKVEVSDNFDQEMCIVIVRHHYDVQWRPVIIVADNAINQLLLSKSVVTKHSI